MNGDAGGTTRKTPADFEAVAAIIRALAPLDEAELLEKIARAIGNNVHDRGGFDAAGEANQAIYRSDARAVLRAMECAITAEPPRSP